MRLKLSEIHLGFKNRSFKILAKDLPERGIVYKNDWITGNISLENENKYYRIIGKLNAKTIYICVRCVKNFSFNIVQKVNILILPDTESNTDEKNIDFVRINKSNNYVDLSNAFADLIALSEPLKPLCHEKCAGICYYCGIQKTNHCSCEDQKDTSIWDNLKKINI